MRDKNFLAGIPVERISSNTDSDEQASFRTSSRIKNQPPSRKGRVRKKERDITAVHTEDSSTSSICNMGTERQNQVETSIDERRNVTCIVRKKVTGADNWNAFLQNNRIDQSRETGNNIQLNVESGAESTKRNSNNCVAIDCEMVGTGDGGKENMLARVSVVNSMGECLYDTFVKPTATVTDYRTPVSGVRPCDLIKAEKFSIVQKKVSDLIHGKLLVGHAVLNDLIALKLWHPRQDLRDTTRFKKFYSIGVGTPSLKKLTAHFLNVDIQCGEHSSIQDAQAAMQLYMLFRKEWEADVRRKRHLAHYNHHTKKPKTSYKPKRFGKKL